MHFGQGLWLNKLCTVAASTSSNSGIASMDPRELSDDFCLELEPRKLSHGRITRYADLKYMKVHVPVRTPSTQAATP